MAGIAEFNWAWNRPLPPAPRLLLMSLTDRACMCGGYDLSEAKEHEIAAWMGTTHDALLEALDTLIEGGLVVDEGEEISVNFPGREERQEDHDHND